MDQQIERSALERVLLRDRMVTLTALVAASLLAWAYIGTGMGGGEMAMSNMAMPGMAMPAQWTASYFALMAAMWIIMMVAMMLPSAAPMILLFAAIRRRREAAAPFAATALFAFAYLAVWAAVGLAATALQWLLDRAAALTPAIAITNAIVAAIVLIAAGAWQFTPLKQACLRYCRSPLMFITQYWGRGPFGLGLTHGLYCLGCCWMLMALLFVGGVMNLAWVALIALYVLAEKVAPRGPWVGYVAGAALIVAGLWQLNVALSL
jgi:predicted metal-binding membrane protein